MSYMYALPAYSFSSGVSPEIGYQTESLFPEDSGWGEFAGGLTSVGSGAAAGALAGSAILPGVGTVIGGIGGGLIGGISYLSGAGERDAEVERAALAEELMSGNVPYRDRVVLSNALNAQYGDARRQLGGYLGRAGLDGSTIASHQIAQSYNNQGMDLAGAIANAQATRRQQGLSLLGMNQDIMAQRRADQANIGAGIVNTLSLIHENRIASQEQKPTIASSPLSINETRYPLLHSQSQARPVGTQRGGHYTPSRPALSLQSNGYGGGNRMKTPQNNMSLLRKQTGVQPMRTPSFSGR